MDIFIDTPRRLRERSAPRELGDAACGVGAGESVAEGDVRARVPRDVDFDLDEPDAMTPAAGAYARELAYDRARGRRRALGRIVHVLAGVVLLPLAIGIVFFATYALTYVLNGATPEELMAALADVWTRIVQAFSEVLRALPHL